MLSRPSYRSSPRPAEIWPNTSPADSLVEIDAGADLAVNSVEFGHENAVFPTAPSSYLTTATGRFQPHLTSLPEVDTRALALASAFSNGPNVWEGLVRRTVSSKPSGERLSG